MIGEVETKIAEIRGMITQRYWCKIVDHERIIERVLWLLELVAKLQTSTHCAYCGTEFPVDDSAAEVTDHIRSCEDHPMRRVERENLALRERVRELESNHGPSPVSWGQHQARLDP